MKGWRKVFAFTFVEGIATWAWLAGMGDMTPELWVGISEWTFTAFVAGNAVEHGPALATSIKGLAKKK
jgi:hypothetical protein